MISRAIVGLDLLVDVVPGRGVRARLEQALRDAVRTGRLAAGVRLPSTRQLAADLGVARNTVAEVYTQLIAEGYLQGRAGSGTVVAATAGVAAATRAPSGATAPSPPSLDLHPGMPDVSLFPRAAWAAATRSVLDRAPSAALGYGDPRGAVALREAVAGYLARTRGVLADPERIVVCSGYTQLVDLVLRVMAARGRTRFVAESPGLTFRTPESVRAHGTDLVPLPVDASGACVDLLDELCGGDAAAVTLTPAHQFPTGTVLAPGRRTAVTQWAQRTDTLLIEDDYDGEFRYDRAPVGAMHGLAPEQIAYVGTASKALAPALRLAWTMLPARLVDEVADLKSGIDRHAPTIDQLVLADLLDSGGYDRQVRRARLVYRARRARLDEVLAPLPGVEVVGKRAGLQALIRLPPGSTAADERGVVDTAARRGLTLVGLADLVDPGQHLVWGPGLVIGYATPPGHAFDAALDLLRKTLVSALGIRP